MKASPVQAAGLPYRPRVLVVDDNAAFLDNMTELLGDEGYEVSSATSCAAALERAKKGFDVALVDVRLPDGEGTSLAPRLKELMPDGEVVLLTGLGMLEAAVAAVHAGACAYLLKPCATPELLLTLEQALRQVRLHREKRELARRAQVTEKLAAVGTLTAGLSHEIRNPLNAAGLQLTVLERRVRRLDAAVQGPLLEPLMLVRDEIRRLDHILEDFLQFARPREFQSDAVEVAPLLERVRSLLSGQAEERDVALEVEPTRVVVVRGDEERLRQVLLNLALNALQAAPPGGRVCFSASTQGDEVALCVDDNGPGIPADVQARLFEPFFTTKASGSGLGLSIVHAIVTQHGGTIAVEAGPLGGARFTVRLPALADAG
ncbi:hybrid sensor histidine kinase/response regulator [Corallococcus sp. CA053C]|uniref:sensor histidine kinase n=1 Tax=Corallococcus sp. CA053C TaxID=2316732 RepID=UPI000EA3DD8C|nr:ATP-binding protein [Corallococcus sp. CA053C]RKH04011.1 hybrid sensor histidine kinase/response regulator [Corallococcus sp. CA053C]